MRAFSFLLFAAFISISFAERFEITYSSYTLELYNSETKEYGYGGEKTIQGIGSIIMDYSEQDSNYTIYLMNIAYNLKTSSYYETVNQQEDSVAVFTMYDIKTAQEYFLVFGPEYTIFTKSKYWKLSFETPQKLNSGIQNSGQNDPEIITGSSFAITKHELITNNHVIEGKKSIFINKNPETRKGYLKAYVLYRDPDLDLAVLHTDSNLVSCAIDRNIYDIGEDIYVYGYPQVESQGISLKLTKGVISSKRGYRDDVKTYQIDAAVQPGNSGGPLVRKGKIIGVTSARLPDSQNVNYAIKSNFVGAIIDVLGIKNTGKADPKNCTYFVIGGNE